MDVAWPDPICVPPAGITTVAWSAAAGSGPAAFPPTELATTVGSWLPVISLSRSQNGGLDIDNHAYAELPNAASLCISSGSFLLHKNGGRARLNRLPAGNRPQPSSMVVIIDEKALVKNGISLM
jgi:hypothetical protein